MGLVAEQPGAGGLQEGLGLEEVEVPASVGGEDGESGGVEGGDGVVEGYAGDHGQVEEASGGGAHDLRCGGVHAAAYEDDGVGSGGVGGPDDGAGVPGVLGLGEDGDEPGPLQGGGQCLGAGGLLGGHDGEEALGVGAHGVHDLLGGDVHVELGCHGLVPDLAVAREGRLGEVDVEHAARGVPDSLAHTLGAFDEEATVLGPRVAAGQARHPGDAGRGRIAQHLAAGGRPLADGAPPRPAGSRPYNGVI